MSIENQKELRNITTNIYSIVSTPKDVNRIKAHK